MRNHGGLSWVVAALVAIAALGGCASDGGPNGRGLGPNGGAHGGGFAGGRPGMPTGPSVDEIIHELGLSEERAAEVRGVLEASEDERSEIAAKHAGARGPDAFDEVRKELDDLRARTEAMLEPLLTDEQMEHYRQIIDQAEAERERMMEGMRQSRPMGRGPGTGRPPGF